MTSLAMPAVSTMYIIFHIRMQFGSYAVNNRLQWIGGCSGFFSPTAGFSFCYFVSTP